MRAWTALRTWEIHECAFRPLTIFSIPPLYCLAVEPIDDADVFFAERCTGGGGIGGSYMMELCKHSFIKKLTKLSMSYAMFSKIYHEMSALLTIKIPCDKKCAVAKTSASIYTA